MKKSFILMLFSMLFASFGLAQTAVLTQTSCNSLNVSLSGACGNGFYGQGYYDSKKNVWYLNAYKNYTYKVTLIKTAGNSSPYPEVTYYLEGASTASWANLEQGATYKVIIQPFNCTNVPAYDVAGRRLGFTGYFGDTFSSNFVTTGPSRLEDNVSSVFKYGFSIGNNPPGLPVFSPTDIVYLNANASKNYDAFWLAIFEINPNGTSGRSTSLGGWQFEQIGIRNLSAIWGSGGPGWTFLPYYKYRVQLAISKNSCGSWTEVDNEFLVCPPMAGQVVELAGKKLRK